MKKRFFAMLLALTFVFAAGMTVCLAENESGEPVSSETSSEASSETSPDPSSDISSDPSSDVSSDVSSDPSSDPSSDVSSGDPSSDVSSGTSGNEVSYEYTPSLNRSSVNAGSTAVLTLSLNKNGSSDFTLTAFNATVTLPFAPSTVSYTLGGTQRTVDVEKNGNNYAFDIAYRGGAVSAADGVRISITVDEEATLGQFTLSVANVEVGEENGSLTTAKGTANTVSLTVGEKYPTLSRLSVDGYELSQPFDPETLRYSVTVAADTTELTIRATPKSGQATVSYRNTVYEDGIIPIAMTADSMTVTLTVAAGGTNTYRITFTKEGAEEVSSEEDSSEMTSSEEDPVTGSTDSTASGDTSSDGDSQDNTSDTVTSGGLGGTVSVEGNNDKGNRMGLLTVILIVLLALACGFVFCLILVRNGAFGGKGEEEEKEEFPVAPVDEAAFEKASAAQKSMGTAYTATRVMPIPQTSTDKAAQGKKFEINFEYDGAEVADTATEAAGVAGAVVSSTTEDTQSDSGVASAFEVIKPQETADEVFSAAGNDEMESTFNVKAPEEKEKKRSFFFDDEEF